MSSFIRIVLKITALSLLAISPVQAQDWSAVTTIDGSAPSARHESNAIVYNGMIYLFGGRGNNPARPVDRYNPATNVWETIAQTPLEMHHFQPVLHNGLVYIIGAFSCCYPEEPVIADIYVFNLATNTWSIAGSMPADRLRGSVGAVSHNNKIYLVGGNTNGHSGGAVSWFDEYDPATGSWNTLPDAPTRRDHFSAAIINDKLIATGGRQTNRSFDFTVVETDVFDFNTNQWSVDSDNIPTQRAGTMSVVYDAQMIVIGGESVTEAHNNVEVFNPATNRWRSLPGMINPRHAGGTALIGSDLHVFAGSTTRGASGESNFHEVLDLSVAQSTELPRTPRDTDRDGLSDSDELNIYFTDMNLRDTDEDGLSDYEEIFTTATDPNRPDTDNDSINDLEETTLNLDPNSADTDSDALEDGEELNTYFTKPDVADTDADGLNDGSEVYIHNTDPLLTDSDNDQLDDGFEVTVLRSNPLNTDSDDDGLPDYEEHNSYGTSLTNNDTDSDGLSDSDELTIHLTDPVSDDTDDDGVRDGDEIYIYGSDPHSDDSDGDGITDSQEIAAGTSAINMDEDNDGLINRKDGHIDTDLDGIPNYADRDSDNDGIPDLIENGFDDLNNDGQLDTNAGEVAPAITSTAMDSDGDGVPNFIDLDSDQDGLPDLAEGSSDYTTSDTMIADMLDLDQDGLSDHYSTATTTFPVDSDGDFTPDYLDLDSDDDGISDVIEAGLSDLDEDRLIDNFIDTDNDGLIDIGRPQLGQALPDSDNDQIPDVIDSELSRRGLFGCSLGSKTTSDPVFLIIFLLSIAGIKRQTLKQARQS